MFKKPLFIGLSLIIVLISNTSIAQTRKILKAAPTKTIAAKPIDLGRPFTRWSLKTGGNISVIYLARNVKDNNNEPGFCGGLNYEVNNFVRVSTLFTRFRPINIEPTWLNVKANSYEMNVEVVARFPNKKNLTISFCWI